MIAPRAIILDLPPSAGTRFGKVKFCIYRPFAVAGARASSVAVGLHTYASGAGGSGVTATTPLSDMSYLPHAASGRG